MLIFGVLATLTSAGVGSFLAWENRDAIVRVHVGDHAWSGHLYGVLILGALLACWFLLGISCVHVRIRERRQRRAVHSQEAPATPVTPAAPVKPATAVTADRAPNPDRAPATHRTHRPRRHVGAVGFR